MTKRCPSCSEVKPLDEFYRLARSKDGRQGYCKPCANRKRQEWGRANPEKDRAWDQASYYRVMTPERRREKKLLTEFKMSVEEYDAPLQQQGGVCAACRRPPSKRHRLQVDHDHACCPNRYTCGRCIRGLLCLNCNTILGHAKDSKERLLSLIDYLGD